MDHILPDPDPAVASFCVSLRLRLECHCAAAVAAALRHPSSLEHTTHPSFPQGVGFLRQQPFLPFCRQRQHLSLSPVHFDFFPEPRLRGRLLPPMAQRPPQDDFHQAKKRCVCSGGGGGFRGRHHDLALTKRSPKPPLLSKIAYGRANAPQGRTRNLAKSGG